MERMIRDGELLEYAVVYGQLYGTPLGPVRKALDQGKIVLLRIEAQGARQVKRLFPDAISIFVLPPALGALEQRLRSRAQDPDPEIRQRLTLAAEELRTSEEYDYRVVNDDLDQAVEKVKSLIRGTDRASGRSMCKESVGGQNVE